MEPSFETILCNLEFDLELVSELELVYPQLPLFARPPAGPKDSRIPYGVERDTSRPKSRSLPILEPNTPSKPPPAGWVGTQLPLTDALFEVVRSGMWHDHWPGEARIQLDYSAIVSAYDEEYISLAQNRSGVSRLRHRLGGISAQDKERLKANVRDVLSRPRIRTTINWPTLFQGIIDQYGYRLEDLRDILRCSKCPPHETVALARQKVLIMLMPSMVLPRVKHRPPLSAAGVASNDQTPLEQSPEGDWISRIYQTCSISAMAGLSHKGELTKQEKLLVKSINSVQGEICPTLTGIWSTAFDSESKPILSQALLAEWKTEIEDLMGWLDWHVWVKCDPPCGPGLTCTLPTWPWEVGNDEAPVVPTCRNSMIFT